FSSTSSSLQFVQASTLNISSITISVESQLTSRTTLFPYTTLFRSGMSPVPVHSHQITAATNAMPDRRETSHHLKVSATKTVAGLDRKSTRLNSSHVKISYAVFCLKKKKCHSICLLLEFFKTVCALI